MQVTLILRFAAFHSFTGILVFRPEIGDRLPIDEVIMVSGVNRHYLKNAGANS